MGLSVSCRDTVVVELAPMKTYNEGKMQITDRARSLQLQDRICPSESFPWQLGLPDFGHTDLINCRIALATVTWFLVSVTHICTHTNMHRGPASTNVSKGPEEGKKERKEKRIAKD